MAKPLSYIVIGISFLCGLFAAGASVSAAEIAVVVAKRVIYPRDIIRSDMVRETQRFVPDGSEASFINRRNIIVGKMSVRTLLPGTPIRLGQVIVPFAVKHGRSVNIRFEDKGIVIVANGIALQSGSIGNLIRVRNVDSGTIISAVVVSPNTVRIGKQ